MRVKVTITGTVNLSSADERLLENATPEEALATLRAQDVEPQLLIERPAPRKHAPKSPAIEEGVINPDNA